jgi:hypothetical protein
MAGMVLLMEIPCLLMIIGTLQNYKTAENQGTLQLKDDDIKFKYNTLIILLPCSYFEIPYI